MFALHDGGGYQEVRPPNERAILDTLESDVNYAKKDSQKDSQLSFKLEDVKNLPEIIPHKCLETRELHRGEQMCIVHHFKISNAIYPKKELRPRSV